MRISLFVSVYYSLCVLFVCHIKSDCQRNPCGLHETSSEIGAFMYKQHSKAFLVLRYLTLYKSGSMITTKISLNKLTYKMQRYHRITLRNKERKEVQERGLGRKGVGKHLGKGFTKGSLKNRQARNLYINDELFD